MEKILVFTATYNEADNVRDLISAVHKNLANAHILVVDDNSPDLTGEILDEIAETDPLLHIIHRPGKLGLGNAHKLALKYAQFHQYDHLITMDADFSHNPNYLPTIMNLAADNDFVIGSRYVEGGKCDYGWIRNTFSKGANHMARFLLGIKVKETTTSYRCFSKKLINNLNVDRIKAEGYSFFVEAIYRVSQCTDKVAEFPIHFVDRRFGTTKISKAEIYKALFNLFRLFLMRINPFHKLRPVTSLKPEDLSVCNNCHTPYHLEIYPSTFKQHKAEQYKCTSTGHASHGRIVQCLTCGLVYTNPQLTEEQVNALYTDAEDTTYAENISARQRTFDYNFKKVFPLLKKGGKLLDVGSYCGVFLKIAQDYGFNTFGIEPSKWASKFSKEKYNIATHNGILEDAPEDYKNFDTIVSWDCLEHFSNPKKELHLMNSKLNMGGILAFSTLNFDNWFPQVMGEKWPWLMDMHLYYYNKKNVEDLLRKTGFALVRSENYCHIITLDYFFLKLQVLGVPFCSLVRKFILLTPLRRIYIPFRFGDIQLFIAKKVMDVDLDKELKKVFYIQNLKQDKIEINGSKTNSH